MQNDDFFEDFFEDSEYSSDKPKRSSYAGRDVTLPDTVAWRALDLLHLDVSLEVKGQIIDYMKKSFETCHCCVLSSTNKTKPKKFLDFLGIDLGTQIVIINEDLLILYSENSRRRPEPVAV